MTVVARRFLGRMRRLVFPFLRKEWAWSIGIYQGKSPLALIPVADVSNPVLTASDVTDVRARFVADPFMIFDNDVWYMFFEVLNADTGLGEIGQAISRDGRHWEYRQIVLAEPFSISYPFVFTHGDHFYMIPETSADGTVRLYKADAFPTAWCLVGTLLRGPACVDSTLLHTDGKWWLFSSTRRWDALHLFGADDLLGPWTEHPQSPIVRGNPHIARPGGRMLELGSRIIRFVQDDYPNYGTQVRAFEVEEFTDTSYKERELQECSPVLGASGSGWNGDGMHTIDAHLLSDGSWLACVDGLGWKWALGRSR